MYIHVWSIELVFVLHVHVHVPSVYKFCLTFVTFSAMKSPALTAVVDGRNKTLYLPVSCLSASTWRGNR